MQKISKSISDLVKQDKFECVYFPL